MNPLFYPPEDLPETERMNRELRKVKPEFREPVWRAIRRAARENNEDGRPTLQDLRTAARRLETTSETRRREEGEIITHFERAAAAIRRQPRRDCPAAPHARAQGNG